MDHYRHPRNHGNLDKPDFSSGQFNPSCGDRIALEGTLDDNIVRRLAFTGTGCVISQATASLLTEWSINKSVDEIQKINKDDIQILIGMALGPVRLKCALLPLVALQEGLKSVHTES